ncbi:hypothetical protein CHRY9293_01625 [Chryseobacterium potabilaquae]|uniref:Uncharacterized protein n=2 Tax=Chryseobacterium TaxID=59732 RepID=A0A6N4X3I6_9FLAO|nr:hypothetical protein D1632_15570 [Chryseobacterium nematophagum]CAA7195426.1 hypothetical protein CHRY9293_01625 [Chryseobacterium potabilaquae]
MILFNKKIKAQYLNDGDDLNDWIREDVVLTGRDMIFIADNCSAILDWLVIVNGGLDLTINPDDYVYLIVHFSHILESFHRI